MKATDLAGGMESFSPAPLEFGPDGNSEFYVQRPDDPLSLLRTRLLQGKTVQKFLLAGHRGSGKSTELNRLSADAEIQERYAVVKFSVKDVLDLADLSHIDLLFVAVSLTYDRLVSEMELELSPRAVDQLDFWRRAVEEKIYSHQEDAGGEVKAGAKLNLLSAFFASFSGRLRVEQSTRRVTREVVEQRLSEFLDTLSKFFRDVEIALKRRDKRLLLIIEDLDKIPDITKALDLFHNKGIYLKRPPCHIVYTVPIAIHYSKKFPKVAGTFGQSLFLPNVALYERGSKTEYSPGREMMRSFVLQRLDEGLIEVDALREAVEMSGGVFQQFQRLMEDACTRALTRNLPMITVEEVRSAAAELRNELERSLASHDYPVLDQVSKTLQAPSDDTTQELLHSLHLIEYRNLERWCNVNPLLVPTLKQWHKIRGSEGVVDLG
jgi:hypothetical protein